LCNYDNALKYLGIWRGGGGRGREVIVFAFCSIRGKFLIVFATMLAKVYGHLKNSLQYKSYVRLPKLCKESFCAYICQMT
jgi:hypothetical protein